MAILKHEKCDLEMLRNQKYNEASEKNLGMSWYKFNIYFRLFFTIFTLIGDISDSIMEYEMYGELNKAFGTYFRFVFVFDIILIVGVIATRHWLAYFNKKGVYFYFGIQFISPILKYLAIFIVFSDLDVTSSNVMYEFIATIIVYGILFALEYVYWSKRMHLFGDPYQITMDSDNGTNSVIFQSDSAANNNFCRNCGTELLYNSEFCHECGTVVARPDDKPDNTYEVCIFNAESKTFSIKKIKIDTIKFPPEKFTLDNIYYAVESVKDGKKLRTYYQKSVWDKKTEGYL